MVMLHSVLMMDDSSTYALLTFCLELHFSVLFRCVFVFVRDTQPVSVTKAYNNWNCKESLTYFYGEEFL
jgi:hypothetical protein